jgi:hypothetical protein
MRHFHEHDYRPCLLIRRDIITLVSPENDLPKKRNLYLLLLVTCSRQDVHLRKHLFTLEVPFNSAARLADLRFHRSLFFSWEASNCQSVNGCDWQVETQI